MSFKLLLFDLDGTLRVVKESLFRRSLDEGAGDPNEVVLCRTHGAADEVVVADRQVVPFGDSVGGSRQLVETRIVLSASREIYVVCRESITEGAAARASPLLTLLHHYHALGGDHGEGVVPSERVATASTRVEEVEELSGELVAVPA